MKNYTEIDYSKLSQFPTLYFYAWKNTKVLLPEVEEVKSKVLDTFEIVVYPNSVHGIDIEEDFQDMLFRTKNFLQSH